MTDPRDPTSTQPTASPPDARAPADEGARPTVRALAERVAHEWYGPHQHGASVSSLDLRNNIFAITILIEQIFAPLAEDAKDLAIAKRWLREDRETIARLDREIERLRAEIDPETAAPVAQQEEHRATNAEAAGSTPAGGAIPQAIGWASASGGVERVEPRERFKAECVAAALRGVVKAIRGDVVEPLSLRLEIVATDIEREGKL